MNIGNMCRLPLLGLTALLILSGCAAQRTSMSDVFSSRSAGSMAIIELTAQEEEVFSRTGELDRLLDPTMERLVKYHFVKYSREKRVTMEYFLRNGMSYINHTKSVFRSRGLPQDLAYLAYLESGYNPLAVSSSKATGMWQFIASTGKVYGLRQDWWMDERMDPYRSTQAAADYLTRLYEIFHDWQLAIASYNGGEGAVGRAREAAGASTLPELIRGNDKLDSSLKLREETRLYVPRFLAIAKIMRNAELLGLKPAAPDADHPTLLPVKAISVKPATDLVELSRRLGMTWKLFLAYNPHFLRSVSPVDATSTVYIPQDKADKAEQLLKGNLAGAGWRYYKVARKETFASISKKTGVPASVLRALNPGELKRGKRLRMPSVKGSIPPVEPFVPSYESQPITAEQVRGESHVSAALADLESRVTSAPAEYVVESGDTLSGIAKKFNTTVREIEAVNGGSGKLKTLRAGQIIKLPASPEAKRDVVIVSKKTVAVVPVDIRQREHKV
ncbi:MAG: transglycosylase SLT domain-containing protein, partial [Mailhella sp.]|nr:transglycosylase SLT domain-containing protein [Mailhella sp.]